MSRDNSFSLCNNFGRYAYITNSLKYCRTASDQWSCNSIQNTKTMIFTRKFDTFYASVLHASGIEVNKVKKYK